MKKSFFLRKRINGFELSNRFEKFGGVSSFQIRIPVNCRLEWNFSEAIINEIIISQTLRVKRFLFFWTRVTPESRVDIVMSTFDNFQTIKTISLKEFLNGLSEKSLFLASLKDILDNY